ncbi:MAG TPA: hypothetical protein VF621_12270 [Pyrinomonadaceae bacterium]|jgi:hypothetical protein
MREDDAGRGADFRRARDGRLRLSVDTGRCTHPGCFEQPPEDLLIPDERVVGGDKLLRRPPAYRP